MPRNSLKTYARTLEKMNKLTNRIQAALLNYYTFERQAKLVCTELYTTLNSIGDIVVLTKDNMIIEVEIKISVQDLKNELLKGRETYDWDENNNKANHKIINKHSLMNNNVYTSPNKYYFCVPKSILEETIKFATKLNPKYGVLCFNEDTKRIMKCISVKKKAYYLHKEDNLEKYKNRIIDRLCNDLTKKYRLLYW
jgi:hypothetical protein